MTDVQERLAVLERQVAALTAAGGVATDARHAAIQLLLREMRVLVPYDSCSVQELRGTRLVIIGGVGFADLDVILGESFEINNVDIPNGEVVHRRRPLAVSDTEQYRAFRRGLHVGAGIRSWLGVPLLNGDDLRGMLALDKAEPGYYGVEQQELASKFAALIASTIAQSA